MSPLRRAVQLPLGCIMLGIGVAMALAAKFGADGYSTLMSGITIATGIDFAVVSWSCAIVLVAFAWLRGLRPGIGTVCQLVLVGLTVSLLLKWLPEPEAMSGRVLLFVVGYFFLCVGVATYLATDLGAGPAEGAALAFDPPVPFKWSYTVFQVLCIAVGWWCGAAVGVGTVILAAGIGWTVDRLMPVLGGPPSSAAIEQGGVS